MPSSSGCCPPASLPPAGGGPSLLALLWYLLNPLFWEWARLCFRAFNRKFFLSLFSLWLSHSLGCYLRLAPSDCPQGIQARYPPYACSPRLPVQPPPLLADMSFWATSPLGLTGRHVICGFFFFISSWLCCPLRFQNSPQTGQ